MISYIQVLDVFKTFAQGHLQIQKFDFEFREQMPNLATVDEAYPMLFIVPVGGSTLENVREFDIDVYCVDRYQTNRSNVNYVISDTDLILGDLTIWLEEGQDDIEVVRTYTTTPINNDLLDNVGGHVMRMRVQVDRIALCEIPFDGEAPAPPTCPSAIVRNSNGTWSDIVPSGGTYIVPDTPVTVTDQDGNPLGGDSVPSVTGGNIEVTIAPIGDGEAVLKDTDGNVLSTTPVPPETTVDIVAPDATVEINGVNEGSFTAGSAIDLQLTDGTNPVTPVSVGRVGNTVTMQVPGASTGWVRNPDWLPLPEITAADNRFVGLFLVFEGGYNELTVQATSGAANIDWGDGTSVVSNFTVQSKVYDYSSIVSQISQYYDGRNYKQVIVDITYTGIGTLSLLDISRNTTTNNNGTINFVDISVSLPAGLFVCSASRKCRILERLFIYNWTNTAPYTNELIALRKLYVRDWSTVTSGLNAFRYVGNIEPFNFVANSLTNIIGFYSESEIVEFGDITANLVTSFTSVFSNTKVRKIGNTTLNSATSVAFIGSMYMRNAGVFYLPSVTNISNFASGCSSLKNVEIHDCSLVTTTTNAFSNCLSLERVILNGITVGFSIAQGNLTAQALNDLFNSLGTASGSQTIIITGNPGAATCDTTIATAKGFTVTT
jgi:hypothetical protein